MSSRKFHGPAAKAIREALGIRHGVFAARVGISAPYLTNIERGIKQPSPAVAKAIADGLNIPLETVSYSEVAA